MLLSPLKLFHFGGSRSVRGKAGKYIQGGGLGCSLNAPLHSMMLSSRLSSVSWASASWHVSISHQSAATSLAFHRFPVLYGRHGSSSASLLLSIRRFTFLRADYSKDTTIDGNRILPDDVNDAAMARYNILTRRLYRTLLRTCRQQYGVGKHAKNRSISIDDTDNWILLQPTMDPRLYGYANIVTARRGYNVSSSSGLLLSPSILDKSGYTNCAAVRMSNCDVKMAMEVLRFTHEQMGGDPDDDLFDYYLGTSSANANNNDDEHVKENDKMHTSASSGKHSEGHYTQFIDDDPERGRRFVNCNDNGETIVDEWDSSDDDDNDDGEEVGDMSSRMHDKSVLVTYNDIKNAIR